MMNILFLGRFYPKKILETISQDTDGKVGFSNHNFEKSLIAGFSSNDDVNLRVVTSPMVFSFPHNNKKAIIKKEQYIENGISIRSTGFFNLAFVNTLSSIFSLVRVLCSELKKYEGNVVNVVVNTPNIIHSIALEIACNFVGKKINKLLIIPDVPECITRMDNKKGVKSRIVSVLNRFTAYLSKRYDKYVFLADAMNDFYNVPKSDYIVMEGLIDKNKKISENSTQSDKEIILYAGTLRRIFGVMNLIEVFTKGNFDNTELWICGSGECAEEIEKIAAQSKCIKFFGLVDSSEAIRLQSIATILANPRSSAGEYTKYSFPSKTIEYLLAGKTVIMNRLPGIPKEYDQYLNYPESEDTDSWINKINDILKMDKSERNKKNQSGRDYILSNKTANIQCRRIINLFSGINL